MSYEGKYNIVSNLNSVAQNLSTEAAAYQCVSAFLGAPISNTINDLDRQFGVSELYSQFNLCKNDISEISDMFSGDFKIDTSSALGATTSITDKIEKVLDTYENLEDFTLNIIDKIGNIDNIAENAINVIGGNIDNFVTNITDQFTNTIEAITDFDVTNTIERLPELVQGNLMNLTIISDPLIAIMTIKDAATSIVTQIMSLTAPTNIASLRDLLSKLKEIAAAIDSAKSAVERAKKSIEDLAERIKSGDYINLLLSLATSGVTFFQQPMQYNTRYPSNLSWKTKGGFIYEEDNTEGSERKSFHHPTGTGYYINPDGVSVYEGKQDIQVTTTNNMDVQTESDLNITVQKNGRIVISGNCDIEVAGTAKISAIGDVHLNSQKTVNLNGTTDVNLSSTANINMTGLNVEVSALGLLTLSGTAGVNIISKAGVGVHAGYQTSVPPVPIPGVIHMKAQAGIAGIAEKGPVELIAGLGAMSLATKAGAMNMKAIGPIAMETTTTMNVVVAGSMKEMAASNVMQASTTKIFGGPINLN